MRKQLTAEDLAMVFQWIIAVLLTPFVLLPLFPREPVAFDIRLGIVLGGYTVTAIMTVIYLYARGRSRKAAEWVVNITATLDVILIFVCLMAWPRFLPDLFFFFPLLVIVVAARYGYRETALAAVGLSALYAITLVVRLDGSQPARTVVADTVLRIGFLFLVAMATVYITRRERRLRREAHILSMVAIAMGSTLDPRQLMDTVVEGISEAAGLGRCSAYLFSRDGLWGLPESTTETDPDIREKFLSTRIDLMRKNVVSRAAETGQPLVVIDSSREPLLDRRWIEDFVVGPLMVLPIVLRDEVRGVVFVESRAPRRRFYESDVEICNTILTQASAGLENAMRYADEQRKRSESDVLYQASRELTSTLDMDRVLENACRLAMRTCEAAACSAFLLDEANARLQPRLSISADGAKSSRFPEGSSIAVREFEDAYNMSQRPPALRFNRPSESAVIPSFLAGGGALVVAPFFTRGRISGLLCVSNGAGRAYSDVELSQLAAIAGEVSLAVLNARLHETIKSDAVQMASLVQLANAIGSTSDLETIMSLALESVRHLFDCSSGVIYLVDEAADCLRYVDSFGYPPEISDTISSPPHTRIGECWTVAEGRLIGVDDLSAPGLACATLERIGRGSSICVGMQAEGRTLGVLHVRSDAVRAFGEQDQQLALAIADQVALAIQRALLFEQINRLAVTDPLTGVFNVRRLEAVLADEVSRARRYERPVSFLMVDVDNLKAYNDTLGHQKGDVVLSQIASIIDSNTRDVDKVFRYGGDEFCVVLPETGTEEALVVAEKVRRAVYDFHFPGEERLPVDTLSISIGLASLPADAQDEEGLVSGADMALYAAKQRGRNSVASAGRSDP
ncbi:MAG: diguanylate cyclase [Actinomycetota bacterium]